MKENVKVLDSIEAVRKRPHMFIGSTKTPDHLLQEVLDNAFDELKNGNANRITLYFKDNAFWVTDNGRGLPLGTTKLPSGEEIDSIEAITTVLFSGTKFDMREDESYIGMHGVGLVAVNALSNWLEIWTREKKNRNKIWRYRFEKSELKSKECIEDNRINEFTTIVGFEPNNEFFDSLEVNKSYFMRRFLLAKAKFPQSNFIVNGKEIPNVTLSTFAREELGLKEDVNLAAFSYQKKKNNNITIFLAVQNQQDFTFKGEVNLRPSEGEHLNQTKNLIRQIISNKLSNYKNIRRDDFLLGINCYVSVTLPEGQFDSQTKRVLETDVSYLVKPLEKQLSKFFNDEILDIIRQNLEYKYHKKLTSKKTRKKLSVTNKVKDAIHIPGEVLYIVEGDSAAGTLTQIRDKETEGIFPLKGVPLNPEKNTLDKINKNTEIIQLLEALGSAPDWRYDKIKILADADTHGRLITAICSIILWRLVPDKVKEGKVFICLPPLFAAKNKNKEYFLHTSEQLEQFKQNKNFEIIRFKGLGEMNPDQLKRAIRSGVEYQLQPPQNKQTMQLITNTEMRKQLLNDKRISFETMLKIVQNLNQ